LEFITAKVVIKSFIYQGISMIQALDGLVFTKKLKVASAQEEIESYLCCEQNAIVVTVVHTWDIYLTMVRSRPESDIA
jgi:uncharacterized protein involved in tellurium resistance